MPSTEATMLVEMLRAAPVTRGTIEERRAFMETMSGAPMPDGTTVDVVDMDGVPGERVAAGGVPDDAPAVLWLHGGAYVTGSPGTHRAGAQSLSAAAGAVVYLADYRLAPEHPFPAAVDDAMAAYRWLTSRVDASRAVLAGDSAGGGLTIATLVSLRDAGDALPAAAVVLSPWTDLVGDGESWTTCVDLDPMCTPDGLRADASLYLGDAPATNPLASPIHADLAGLPPMHITVGEHEILLDDSLTLAARARAAGVDVELDRWPEMVHVFPLFAAMLPEGAEAMTRIGTFINARTA